jgi:hypothetical protein
MFHYTMERAPGVRARTGQKRRKTFGPSLEALENRVVLHAGVVSAHHAALVQAAGRSHPLDSTGLTSAETQLMSTISATISSYNTLQVQLDSLAARLQHQKTSAQRTTASKAQNLVKKFIKLENKRYKPLIALEPSVSGTTAGTALLQFEQGLHQSVLMVKTQVLPQFRLLVGATFASAGPKSRVNLDAIASAKGAGQGAHTDAARPADENGTPEVNAVLFNLQILLTALISPLNNIAGAPDDSCAFTAAHSLAIFSHLLDLAQVFYEVLSPLASEDVANAFVGTYNLVVGAYNNAVTATNKILASGSIHTH